MSSPEPVDRELTPEEIRAERLRLIEDAVNREFESKQTELQTLKDLKKKCEDAIKGEDAAITAKSQLDDVNSLIEEHKRKLEHYKAEQIKYQRIVDGAASIPEYKTALENTTKRIKELEKELK